MSTFGINSDCFSAINYDEETGELTMMFKKSGLAQSVYTIENFPAIEAARWADAASAGGYFNANVKGKY